MSDHMLTQISTWTEVAILLFMVWEKYGPNFGIRSMIGASSDPQQGSGVWSFLRKNRTLILAVIGLGIVAWLHLGSVDLDGLSPTDALRAFNKSEGWSGQYNFEKISRKTFKGENVLVDGREFVECTFDNVTLIYNGTTPPRFTGNTFIGRTMLSSNNYAIDGIMGILELLRYLPQNSHITLPEGTLHAPVIVLPPNAPKN